MNSGPDLYFCSVAMDFVHGSAEPTFLRIDIPGTRVGTGPGRPIIPVLKNGTQEMAGVALKKLVLFSEELLFWPPL